MLFHTIEETLSQCLSPFSYTNTSQLSIFLASWSFKIASLHLSHSLSALCWKQDKKKLTLSLQERLVAQQPGVSYCKEPPTPSASSSLPFSLVRARYFRFRETSQCLRPKKLGFAFCFSTCSIKQDRIMTERCFKRAGNTTERTIKTGSARE